MTEELKALIEAAKAAASSLDCFDESERFGDDEFYRKTVGYSVDLLWDAVDNYEESINDN